MRSPQYFSNYDSNCNINSEEINPTSSTLLLGIKNNEKEAWDRFVFLYQPLIRFWCRRAGKVLTLSDRQDITQQVLFKVSRAIIHFDKKKSLRAWLQTITKNTIIDFLRKYENTQQFEQLLSDTNYSMEEYASVSHSALDLSEDQKERITLIRQIRKLLESKIKKEHWEIFDLFVNAGKTPKEIGLIMNMKPDTARKIKQRIIKQFQDEIQKIDQNEILF